MQSGLLSLSCLIFKLSPHMFLPEPEHFQLKKKSECREMCFGIITRVLHFYLSKNYSSTEGHIL